MLKRKSFIQMWTQRGQVDCKGLLQQRALALGRELVPGPQWLQCVKNVNKFLA